MNALKSSLLYGYSSSKEPYVIVNQESSLNLQKDTVYSLPRYRSSRPLNFTGRGSAINVKMDAMFDCNVMDLMDILFNHFDSIYLEGCHVKNHRDVMDLIIQCSSLTDIEKPIAVQQKSAPRVRKEKVEHREMVLA
jgi:hypothetical protein